MVSEHSPEKRLFRKVKQGKAVLFLGAGTSQIAGAPSGHDLARLVHNEFIGGANPTNTDFIEVLTQIINTLGIDRKAVEDFMISKLNVKPTQTHFDMCRIRWKALLTTNYDDIVETAYRNAPIRAQDRCELVFNNRFSRTESEYLDIVKLFKLMGSVNGTDRDSRMALSRSDYHRKIQQRDGILRLVKDFAKDGTIIYAGYSFTDLIIIDILNEIREEIPVDEMPWGWAILTDWDEKTEQMLRERRILPLKTTFEEFINHAVNEIDKVEPEETSNVFVTVAGTTIEIPKVDLTMYRRQFDFCHDDLGNVTITDRNQAVREFLEAQSDPWIGIIAGWAFERKKNREITNGIRQILDKPLDGKCPIILVLGPAGSGKSIAARMLACEIYSKDEIPTLLLNTETEQIDYRVIDSYTRFINETVEAAQKIRRRLPILIIIDEAAARMQDVRRLPQYLVSRGIPAIIVAFARENEWRQAEGDIPIKVEAIYNLPDQFEDDEEAELLIKHIRRIGVLESAQNNEYWLNLVKTDYEYSFWNTLYYLADPTRPPLTQSVCNEYDRLLSVAQIAYRYICSFYRFGVPLDLELVARSLHRSYAEFVQSVYDPASLGVIIELAQPSGTRYRSRTRMVAEKIAAYIYQDTDDWLSDIKHIVSNVIPNNVNEVETIRNLLIRRLGPNGTQKITPADKLIPIFEAAFEAGMHDSATLHHCALLLLAKNDFDRSEYYLGQAMEVLNNPWELPHFKTEWRQMIDNSLAGVISRKGFALQSSGQEEEAEKQFQRAIILYRRARHGEFPTSYPFYGEAWMLFRQSANVEGIKRLALIAQALEVIDQAEGNIDNEGQSSLAELESKILSTLSEIPSLGQVLGELIAKGEECGGYLQARYQLNIFQPDDRVSQSILEKAYSNLIETLDITPNHIPCLRLAARLHRKIYPYDWDGWWAILRRRERLEGTVLPNSLLYDLAFAATQCGDYPNARVYFERLEMESSGHPRRSGIINTIKDKDKDRRIVGEVKHGFTKTAGWLRCDTIGQDIRFYPLRQKFKVEAGQNITFVIALNYRGFLAIELRPL